MKIISISTNADVFCITQTTIKNNSQKWEYLTTEEIYTVLVFLKINDLLIKIY